MAEKKQEPDTSKAESKTAKVEVVLNEDGTPAITDEERQASIDRHQKRLAAAAGTEAP